jgi:hypothetical protein
MILSKLLGLNEAENAVKESVKDKSSLWAVSLSAMSRAYKPTGRFFPLASFVKQLDGATMRLLYCIASRKNTLVEIDNLSFTRS